MWILRGAVTNVMHYKSVEYQLVNQMAKKIQLREVRINEPITMNYALSILDEIRILHFDEHEQLLAEYQNDSYKCIRVTVRCKWTYMENSSQPDCEFARHGDAKGAMLA